MSPCKFSVLLTWVLSVITQAQGGFTISGITRLSTTPPQRRIFSGLSLDITCGGPLINPNQQVVDMTLERVLLTNVGAEPETVAKQTASIDFGEVKRTPQTPEGARVSGGLRWKIMRISYPKVNCEDSATYNCSACVSSNGVTTHYELSKTVLVQVNPGPITMDTPGTECCMLGQTLTMTCGQYVGANDDTSQYNWVWEYKDKNDTDWQPYAVRGDITANITQPPSTDPCSTRNHSSSLIRRLTLEDSERQYRCYVNGSVPGQGVDKAQNHTVGTVQALSTSSQETSTSQDSTTIQVSKATQASATNWLAVGLGVAGAVACLGVGVGLGVAYHSRKKPRGQPSMMPARTSPP